DLFRVVPEFSEDLVGVLTKGRCGSAFARRPAVILEGNRHDVEGVTAAAFQFAYVPVGLRLDMFVHLQRSQLWRPCAREALELSDPERERPLSEAAIELVDRLARMPYARLPVCEPGIVMSSARRSTSQIDDHSWSLFFTATINLL